MSCRAAIPVAIAVCALAACSMTDSGPEKLSGPIMGTTWSVKLTDRPDDLSQENLQERIVDTLNAVNDAMSTYLEDAEIVLFNRYKGTDWYPVSDAVADVVAAAQQVSELSDGAFDITVGPLVDLWGFGPDGMRIGPPPAADIDAARARTGYRNLDVRTEPPALRKQLPALSIDLSAIAKGYAVDRVAGLLEELGSQNYLVEVGGELRARGHNAREAPWSIGIERPDPMQRMVEQVMPLRDRGMATSGDYRNFFEVEGKLYSHTIDPRTGAPVEHSLASVSILADSAMQADALATALLVMGPERGAAFARQHEVAAMFIERNTEGFSVTVSPAMQRYLDGESDNPVSRHARGETSQ